jgi:hypothetical protein
MGWVDLIDPIEVDLNSHAELSEIIRVATCENIAADNEELVLCRSCCCRKTKSTEMGRRRSLFTKPSRWPAASRPSP